MTPPLFSTFTLFTELAITGAVFYALYQGYYRNLFPKRVVTVALAYEIIFNISYMTYRALTHAETVAHSPFHIGLAIFHGALSLIMFAGLLLFFGFAWKRYSQGVNFFRTHSIPTLVFAILWALAVLSGVLFYFHAYFIEPHP